MTNPIVAYLSHSYRPEDRAINMAVWRRLNQAGLVFTVDPPDHVSPMDVTFLERLLLRADCFVAIVPDRAVMLDDEHLSDEGASDGHDRSWSRYQALEVRLAIRADKPRLLILESSLGIGPVPAAEPRIYFSRQTAALHGDFDGQVALLRQRAESARAAAHRGARPVGLLRWSPSDEHTNAFLTALRKRLRKRLGKVACEYLEVSADTPDHAVLAAARRFDVVVTDLNPAVMPAYLIGMLHGASIPTYRTCLIAEGEDEAGWSARLALDPVDDDEAATARAAPGLLHGFRIDERMRPVQFWRAAPPDGPAAAGIEAADALAGHQLRDRRLSEKWIARDYFLSLKGNRVFISTPGELETISGAMKDRLDNAGMPAFHYTKRGEMRGGLAWRTQLSRRMHESDLLLGLVSSAYWESNYCVDELAEAVARWELNRMLIVLYQDRRHGAPGLPPFLARNQANPIDDAEETLDAAVDELRQRFGDRAREPMHQEIGRLAELLRRHTAPLQDPARLQRWLVETAELTAAQAQSVASRLEYEVDPASKLVRILLGAIDEEPFGSAALARICVELRGQESDAVKREALDELFSRLRLLPNLHDVRGWRYRRERTLTVVRLRAGPAPGLFALVNRVAAASADPSSWVTELGTLFAGTLEPPEAAATLAKGAGRVAFECAPDELMVPLEWAVVPPQTLPLARLQPVYRRVTLLPQAGPVRATLEYQHDCSKAGPPRVLLFGYGGPTLPHVAAELDVVQRTVQSRLESWGWPAAPLVRRVLAEDATPEALALHVADSDVEVLHLSGHAGFDGDEPVLQLAPGAGGSGLLRASGLTDLLRTSSVRFVYLSCCESAAPGPSDRRKARSLCRAALEAGVPEALAFMWPIGDADVVAFATAYYNAFFPSLADAEHPERFRARFDSVGSLDAARRASDSANPLWAAAILARRADADSLGS